MRQKVLAGVLACCMSATLANATDFTFSETISGRFTAGGVFTGTFTGTVNGDLVTDLSNIAVSFNGDPFNRNGFLFGSHYETGMGFVSGGAVVSLSGTGNNFLFIDSDFPNDTGFTNYLYVVETPYGSGAQGYSGTDVVTDGTLGTFIVTEVPEPTSLVILGAGAAGLVVMRRARKKRAPAAG